MSLLTQNMGVLVTVLLRWKFQEPTPGPAYFFLSLCLLPVVHVHKIPGHFFLLFCLSFPSSTSHSPFFPSPTPQHFFSATWWNTDVADCIPSKYTSFAWNSAYSQSKLNPLNQTLDYLFSCLLQDPWSCGQTEKNIETYF